MTIKETKLGLMKHLLCAGLLLLACTVELRADPVTAFLATWYGALALSAALSAASFGLQMLFRPKVKPQDKNRFQGDIQLQSIGEDIPINEIYGGGLPDGQTGIKAAGNIIYASQIRKTVIETPGGGGGGGKGAPKSPPTREYHYFIDLAVLVGRGPLRIRQIKANTDLLYQAFTPVEHLSGTTYEAEDSTSDSGNVTQTGDADMSGNLRVDVEENEWIEWNNIEGAGGTDPMEMYIVYKASEDISIELTVNGTVIPAVLPNSFGLRQNANFPQVLTAGASNTVRIKNVTDATVGLDCVIVGLAPIDPGDEADPCYLSGILDPNWTNPEPSYDYMSLRDVYDPDPRGCQQYNYQANPNANGEVSAAVPNGTIRIYPGNATQLPDPMLQEHFEAKYGAGSTPAFRNRCYVVFENFEITKYGTVPNFTFVAEHETINSIGELYAHRAIRAGLTEEEIDFSALDAVPLRGLAIAQKQAPIREMELLNRIYDIDIYQDFDGKIVGVIPSDTPVAEIPADEMHAIELPADTSSKPPDADKPFTPIVGTVRDESELPFFLDASFFDPARDFEPGNVHSVRSADAGDRKANIETGIVLTKSEAQKFVDRDLHKQWAEKDALHVSLFYKHTYLVPTDLITVTDEDGSVQRMRIKAMEGWIPGALEVRGTARNALEFPPRLFVVPDNTPKLPSLNPPAPLVGTFIDLTTFREEQEPGFYVAAALTDPHYIWGGAGLYRETPGGDWEALDGIPNQAVMGRTPGGSIGLLGEPPGGWEPGDWDAVNELTVDLYYGELETLTDDQVLSGRNFMIVGNEVIQFANATRDNGYRNRWVIDRLRRGLAGTATSGHAANERAVLYTAAWRWIPQDEAIAGTTRTYKFVASGGDLETASSVEFNWTGRTRYNSPIYTTIDNGAPVLSSDPPVLATESGGTRVFIKRPIEHGYSATIAEVRFRADDDSALIVQRDIGNAVTDIFPTPAEDANVDYRWRNAFRLSGSDGWSSWSSTAFFDFGTPPPPPGDYEPGGDPPGPGEFDPIGCFIDGTRVLMADWSQKRIELIERGDWVMAWTKSGQLRPSFVVGEPHRIKVDRYRDLHVGQDRLGVTQRHPFAPSFNSKLHVEDMEPGMMIREYLKGWQFGEIASAGEVLPPKSVRVTNFPVAHYGTYLVRGSLDAPWKAVWNNKTAY